jgi:hypothetical protein
MRMRSLGLAVTVVAAAVPIFAGAQHQAHQAGLPAPASVELTQCLHVQPSSTTPSLPRWPAQNQRACRTAQPKCGRRWKISKRLCATSASN